MVSFKVKKVCLELSRVGVQPDSVYNGEFQNENIYFETQKDGMKHNCVVYLGNYELIPKITGSDLPKITIVDKRLGLSGQNIKFINDNFIGLLVGEQIIRIGNGKENGTIRTDNFNFPIKYVGSIICQFDKPEKMFAFELPRKIMEDKVYLLYGSTNEEIYTEAVYSNKDRVSKKKSGFMRFYAPVFVKI